MKKDDTPLQKYLKNPDDFVLTEKTLYTAYVTAFGEHRALLNGKRTQILQDSLKTGKLANVAIMPTHNGIIITARARIFNNHTVAVQTASLGYDISEYVKPKPVTSKELTEEETFHNTKKIPESAPA